MNVTPDESQLSAYIKALKIKKLTLEQIRHIDRVLESLNDYGEVRLVVQHGELRYINKVESFKAWKEEVKK